MTRCDGGAMSAAEAKERCIRTLISGPASGVMGAVALSKWLNIRNVIAVDMGGTSFDAALVVDQEPILSAMTRVEGLPLLVPVIELSTIGAGGGSIAWVDVGGALNVGPQSAGAVPGPMCYGKGGTEPTFTDAALVSGLLDPDYFLGGEIELDPNAARNGIDTKIATPLGLSVEEAASGIVALTEAKMAALLEEMTVGKGYDPRDFTLLAYGGGGPLVASALAARLEIPRVVIPPYAATFSAWGMLTLDVVHDFARTQITSLEFLDPDSVRQTFAQLETQAHEALARERIAPENRRLLRSLDMRYEGQEHTLNIALSAEFLETLSVAQLRSLFDDRHEVAYGYRMADPAEVTVYRIRAVGLLDKPSQPSLESTGTSVDAARKGTRRANHRESGGTLEWTVYDRERLQPGHRIAGPAIIEEPTATTIVSPGKEAEVDTIGNLVLNRSTSWERE
jgi:N-methylhydantoinase A